MHVTLKHAYNEGHLNCHLYNGCCENYCRLKIKTLKSQTCVILTFYMRE